MRCIDLRTRNRKRPLRAPEPHIARLWPTRRCPKCKALPGEPCATPSARIQRTPHTARRRATREETARRAHARATDSPKPPPAVRDGAPSEDRLEAEILDAQPAAPLVGSSGDVNIQPPAVLGVELAETMASYTHRALAPNTTRAYASDWLAFADWADQRGLNAMPATPATCALYLTAIAQNGLKLATVRRRAAAITRAHRAADQPTPLADHHVKSVLEGISRTHSAPTRKKVALQRDTLLQIITTIDLATAAGLRDRALLLTGFALALRRSELVALRVEDLQPHPDGLLITLKRSKTDQQHRGHTFLLAHAQTPSSCPVTALRAWITHAKLSEGPIARRLSRTGRVLSPLSAQSITLIIRRRVQAAALPGVSIEDFAGHSLRSGFATQAAHDGYSTAQIRHITRHTDPRTLDRYIQAGTSAKDLARVL